MKFVPFLFSCRIIARCPFTRLGNLVATVATFLLLCIASSRGEISDKPLNSQKPLSTREVCLLLRGGYTNDEVLKEVTARRLLEPVDPGTEEQLTLSGATPAFVNTLKAGNYNLSSADAAAARQRQSEIEQRQQAGRAAEARVTATNLAFLKQSRSTAATANSAQQPPPAPAPARSQAIANQLRDNLVTLRGGRFQPYDAARLNTKKIYALYFSASWCGPCRQFTPSLVEFYDKTIAQHPEFELVLVCADRSEAAMLKYMQTDHMNWPAVSFASIQGLAGINQYSGKGIPDLVLVDDSGRVLSDSFRKGQYVGPVVVLNDLVGLLNPAR